MSKEYYPCYHGRRDVPLPGEVFIDANLWLAKVSQAEEKITDPLSPGYAETPGRRRGAAAHLAAEANVQTDETRENY